MSRINTITITERANLGDYQHRECVLNASIDETESEIAACIRAVQLASWTVHYPERLHEYNKQKALLTSEDDKIKAYAEKYVARFEEAEAEVVNA